MARSNVKAFALGLLLAIALPVLAKTFSSFTPATGILVGNANSSTTTAATSTNVLGLWSGTCNSTTFLRGDGSCQATGAPVQVNATTWTATVTGFTSAPTPVAYYSKNGNVTCIRVASMTGTSNATTFTVTGLPSDAWPVTVTSAGNPIFGIPVTDNGTVGNGSFAVAASNGTITVNAPPGTSAWTNSGTKAAPIGLNACYTNQ